MKLFKNVRGYIVALSAYALLTLLTLRQVTHKVSPARRGDQILYLSQAIGSLYVVVFFLRLLRKTSNLLERLVLALSAAFFLVFFVNTLHRCGYLPVGVPSSRAVAIGIAWIATVFAGIRTLEILARKEGAGGSPS